MNGIVGIGIDIEEIARFDALIASWGGRFERKIFTEREVAYCCDKTRPAQHFAARFAAKEAFAKAIGTGWSGRFNWKDVEVHNDAVGKPSFKLHGGLLDRFGRMNIHVSLTHSASYVAAMVIIEHLDKHSVI